MSKKSKPHPAQSSSSSRWPFGVAGVIAIAAITAVIFFWQEKPAQSQAAAPGGLRKLPKGFEETKPNTGKPPGAAPAGMVWIPGGEFSMGSDDPTTSMCGGKDSMPDARPIHRVYVDGFWMDITEVTNAQFEAFVKATGYVTIAEIAPKAEDFPGAPPENLVAGSVSFAPPNTPVPLNNHLQWWTYLKGANWRHPEGAGSDLKGRENYPVIHIAHADAAAYAKWAGKRLPTEAEWEFSSRGGLSGQLYAWGDDLKPGGKWPANIFEGKFPYHDTGEDGFKGLAPVKQYAPNGYGLYDIGGNVWEWVSDWYRPDTYERDAAKGLVRNPQGPAEAESFDPSEPGIKKRVHKGGSFLCTEQYCTRYMVGTRGKGEPDTGTNHVGFRCVQVAK